MRQPDPTQWPPPRHQWPPGFTATKDGWVRWYAGKTRFVCGKSVPRGDVEKKWHDRREAIDADREVTVEVTEDLSYRDVLSKFLAAMRVRVETGKPRALSQRSLHNYAVSLNQFGRFVGAGRQIAEIGPADFTAYGQKIAHFSPSGYDSEVARIGTMFQWAVRMEYLDKYRPGPNFGRSDKQVIRDARLNRGRSFTPDEIAALWSWAPLYVRCWIALGVCCAFNNSDIGNLPSHAIDLEAGVIDFRRRKTGKVKRVCPIPADVVQLLREYQAPPAASEAYEPLFFRTKSGKGFVSSHNRNGKPTDQIARIFWILVRQAGVTNRGESDGRNFAGLRTTFRNLCPPGKEWAEERDIIMGHFDGSIDADHYVEEIGLDRLRHVVNHVWGQVASKLPTGPVPQSSPTLVRTPLVRTVASLPADRK